MRDRVKDKQCYWCGLFDSDNNPVTVSEDVPPRWLTGIKEVKEMNCVPQCEECKKGLNGLDDAVNGYFRYGPGIHLDKIERNTIRIKNKGVYARKINLNGKEDYAQSNGALLLWLRKLLVGIWYKEYDIRFDGTMYILTPWITYDNPDLYVSMIATPSIKSNELLAHIDEEFSIDTLTGLVNKNPFKFIFIPSSHSVMPLPLQLLRFAIYGSFIGYCLYIPEPIKSNLPIALNMLGKPPLYIENWLKGFPYIPPSTVTVFVNSLKEISAEEAEKKVRL
jgi:hypothetical protein